MPPATAAAQLSVDFTIHETLGAESGPVTPGKMIKSNIKGCLSATVATVRGTEVTTDSTTTFTGTKVIDCGAGNTISLHYRARTSGCETGDVGTWKVTSGTGIFAKAAGRGKLVGKHTLGKGTGTFCKYDGINDRYTGELER